VSSGFESVGDCEVAGYRSGLAAGLGKALADLDDADLMAAARLGFAAVPTDRVRDGATVLEHRVAAAAGVAILDVRLPAGLVPLRHAGDRPEVVGVRLAAVRVGLVRKLLDEALARPVPPSRRRLTHRAIADVVSALEALRHRLIGAAEHPSRADVVAVHTRLDQLGWQVARLFWPEGYRPDHPVRVLFVAELVAGTWVGT
jgi:hypothetical protein